MEEVTLINEARILRDNHLYLSEQEHEKENKKKRGKKGRANFSRATDPSEGAPTGKKGGALDAEQALAAFNSGVWKK